MLLFRSVVKISLLCFFLIITFVTEGISKSRETQLSFDQGMEMLSERLLGKLTKKIKGKARIAIIDFLSDKEERWKLSGEIEDEIQNTAPPGRLFDTFFRSGGCKSPDFIDHSHGRSGILHFGAVEMLK